MLELETARLAARIEELEREKATLAAFAAVAAHELVEPLIITEAFAAMVSDRLDEEIHADSREDLAIVGRTATRTRHLLEALLQDARSGEHALTRRPVDLAAVVDDALPCSRTRSRRAAPPSGSASSRPCWATRHPERPVHEPDPQRAQVQPPYRQ